MSSINRNGPVLDDHSKTRRFEAIALPHLDAAYNLARWLTRRPQDADDLVQMAYVRAFRFFDSYRGGDARVADDDRAQHLVHHAARRAR